MENHSLTEGLQLEMDVMSKNQGRGRGPVPGPGVAGFTEPLVMLLSHLVELLPREHSVVVRVHHGKFSHLHTHTPLRSQLPLGDIAIFQSLFSHAVAAGRRANSNKIDTDQGATSTAKRGRDVASDSTYCATSTACRYATPGTTALTARKE